MSAAFTRYYWAPLLVLFLVVRLFSDFDYFVLEGDSLKYLTLARNFPRHTLFNQQLFLAHPPLIGYLLAVPAQLMPLVQAGLFTALVFALLCFFATKSFGEALGLEPAGIAVALLFVSINVLSVSFDSHISRTGPLNYFMAMALLSLYRHLKERREAFPWRAFVFAALTLLTGDQGVSIYPCLVIVFGLTGFYEKWRTMLGALLALVPFTVMFPLVRLYVYLTHDTFPAGVDGTIERLNNVSLQAILHPNFLPATAFHVGYSWPLSIALENFTVRALLEKFAQFLFLPQWLALTLLAALGLTLLKRLISRRAREPIMLLLLGATLVAPVLFRHPSWYGLSSVIPFALFFGSAVSSLARWKALERGLVPALGAVALVLSGVWLFAKPQGLGFYHFEQRGGTKLLFARTPVTRGQAFAETLKARPEGGIMGPIGLTPELAYLTGGRVVALPLDSAELDGFVRAYQIRYLVFSDEYSRLSRDPVWNRVNSRDAIGAIADRVNRKCYRLLDERVETYPYYFGPSRFFLVEVVASCEGS